MTRWAAFAGVTLTVLALLLVLARLSQSAVDPHVPRARRRFDRLDDGAGHLEATAPKRRPVSPAAATLAEPGPAPTTPTLLANVTVSHGLFGVLLLGGVWLADVPAAALGVTPAPLSTGPPAVAAGLALGVGIALANAAAAGLAGALEVDPSRELRALLAPDSAGGWAVLLGIVLPVIAAFEELLFRAALVGGFAAGFGVSPWPLAVLSSVAFAAGHGAQGRLGVVVTGLLGFVLAAAFVLTGSLLVVVVAHYVVNAVEFGLAEGLGWEPG
ncbi:CPBP family intramembrane metalloprotease [Halobacteriales archaeon QS_4_69_225]|nr:MAG: CPBP family intramembrane metalloprotease [Halobacteriales archaeon QS_4_69_225]